MGWGWESLMALSEVAELLCVPAWLPAVPEILGKEGRSCLGSFSQPPGRDEEKPPWLSKMQLQQL